MFETFEMYAGQILLYILAGAAVLVLEHIRLWAFEWYSARKLHPISRSVLANKNIHTRLIELRAVTDADRAAVFLFHNGQIFSNKNPVWRVSCTQECTQSGISHEIVGLQSMLSSLLWDGLAPLFDDNCGEGVQLYTKGHIKIYIFDVDAMLDSFYKRSMISRGIKTNVTCALYDNKKIIVGYISLNYCATEAKDLKDIDKIAHEIYNAAGDIDYELMKA